MAHVFGRSESPAPQPYICQAAYSGNGLGCANDKDPDTQEPDEAKVSSPVLKQRRGQRWPRRL